MPGFLFDGFPRTVEQVKALDEMLSKHNLFVNQVFNLDVEDVKALAERIHNRALLAKEAGDPVRSDDMDPEKIITRQREYDAKTAPILGVYKVRPNLVTVIDGLNPIDKVAAQINATMSQLGVSLCS